MDDCLFCKISSGQMGTLIYEDDKTAAFFDIDPKAPIHILIVPKKHIASLNEAGPEDENILGHLLWVAAFLATEQGISDSGYRVIINTGPDSGQEVFHIHLHLLGGKPLGRMIE